MTAPPVTHPAAAGAPVLAEVAAAHPDAWADLLAAWATHDPVGDLIGDHHPMPHPTAVLPDAVSAHRRPPRARRRAAALFDEHTAAGAVDTTTRINPKGT